MQDAIGTQNYSYQSFKEILSMAADVASIVGIIGIAIALVSLYVAYKDHIKGQKRKSLENAVLLSKIYLEELLDNISFISSVFSASNMQEHLHSNLDIDRLEDLDFSLIELQELYSGNALSDIEEELDNIDPINVVACSEMLKLNSFDEYKTSISFDKNTKKLYVEDHIKNLVISEFKSCIENTLNKLEWFAMNFTTEIADEKAVYQSLHQTYISGVQQLYYFISKNNHNYHDKVYTNIASLYNLWIKRINETSSKEDKVIEDMNIRKRLNEIQIQEDAKDKRKDLQHHSKL